MLGESYQLIFFVFIIFSIILTTVFFTLYNSYQNSLGILKNLYEKEEIKNLIQEISYASDILKNDSEKISIFLNFLYNNSYYNFFYFSVNFKENNIKFYNYLESRISICVYCSEYINCLNLDKFYSLSFENCSSLNFEINFFNRKYFENITRDFDFYNIFYIFYMSENKLTINKIVKKYNL